MRFSVISSGSKANCTFIEAASTRILIDCGLSASRAAERLLSLDIDPASLDAIIVTHEHSDHIAGIPVLSRKFRIPVFANHETSHFLLKTFAQERFTTGADFWVGGVKVSPFSIVHDAVDPVGFTIQAEGLKFTHVTDLGRVTQLVREQVRGAHAMVLESNHDEEMLRNCDYPWVLKQRISSTHGHLSNITAGDLLRDSNHSQLLHVVLGHLSESSNTPELALAAARASLASTEQTDLRNLICGSIHAATPLLEVA